MNDAEHMSNFRVGVGDGVESKDDTLCGIAPDMEAERTTAAELSYLQDFMLYCIPDLKGSRVHINVNMKDSMFFDLCEVVVYGTKIG